MSSVVIQRILGFGNSFFDSLLTHEEKANTRLARIRKVFVYILFILGLIIFLLLYNYNYYILTDCLLFKLFLLQLQEKSKLYNSLLIYPFKPTSSSLIYGVATENCSWVTQHTSIIYDTLLADFFNLQYINPFLVNIVSRIGLLNFYIS